MIKRVIYFTDEGEKVKEEIVKLYTTDLCLSLDGRKNDARSFIFDGFKYHNPIIFIGALGIAVRMMKDLSQDKLKDSAFIVMDERKRYVIPVLSGHMGGAIELSYDISKRLGSEAVITTATDVEEKFSVDTFARINHLKIKNKEMIKKVSAKVLDGKEFEFHKLICSDVPIPAAVRRLTGISDNTLKGGIKLENGIRSLAEFIRGSVLIGYNIAFDLKFVNREFEKFSLGIIQNRTIDLLHEAKRKNSFQINYKFETTLKEYGIDQAVVHRALEDAKLTYQLFNQMQLKV